MVASHLSHENLADHNERRTKPPSATIDPAINRSELRKLHRTSRTQSQQQKPSQKLVTSPQTTASPPKPLIHRSKIRRNVEASISPIKTRVNSEKPSLTEQELTQTGKNLNSPNKTSNER